MDWNLCEAMEYYKSQGAASDQNALKELLREIQQHSGGAVSLDSVEQVCRYFGLQKSLILALIRRTPSLRLSDRHVLELCAGPNCGKHTALASHAEALCKSCGMKVELKFVPCMRLCGKGPNIRLDGILYHKADTELLNRLFDDLRKNK